MSRYECICTSTFERAGFCLPFSGADVFPERETFIAMSKEFDYIPVCARMKLNNFDFDVVKFYETINDEEPSCLLESLTGNDNGRYSIIACNSLHTISSNLNEPQGIFPIHNFISSINIPVMDFPFFTGGFVGYWSYETGLFYQGLENEHQFFNEQYFFMPGDILVYDRFDNILSVFVWINSKQAGGSGYEKACLRLDSILSEAFKYGKADIMSCQRSVSWEKGLEDEFMVNISPEEFCLMVVQAKEHIRQGDIFQVVLSQRWHKQSQADPWQVYNRLRDLNPSPYMFYLKLPGFSILGASPEMQVKINNGRLKSRPIAGTRKITGNDEVDKLMQEELLQDEKERAEHLMLVDLSRNDVGSVCKAGSIQLPEYMQVERYSHVMHLVSMVEGELKPGVSSMEAFQACFPAGTLSGAPKRKAMEIIRKLEKSPRGPYGGAVGYISFNGNVDSCISIRAIMYKNGTYYLQSGAGIVADSDPEMEYKETLNKARALMLAVKEAEVF